MARPAPQATASASPAQLTRIDVDYNRQPSGQTIGKLIMDVTELAGRGPDFWETFPADFYGALTLKLNNTQFQADEAQAVATIRQKIERYALPWTPAGPGKRLQTGLDNFEALLAKVKQDVELKPDYGKAIEAAERTNFKGYAKRDYFKEYLKMAEEQPARLKVDDVVHGRLRMVLSWLAPLQAEEIGGLTNKIAMMKGMKIVIRDYLDVLESYSDSLIKKVIREKSGESKAPDEMSESSESAEEADVFEPPQDARIRTATARTIKGYQVGERSEIETGLKGAIRSGEESAPRDVETRLSQTLGARYVAGHLVADTLGGKNADYNLMPITETFNTAQQGMAGPEAEGRRRLKAGHAIRYSVFVTYANAGNDSWSTAVRPTRITVEIVNLRLRETLRDGSQIKNYTDDTQHGDPQTFPLTP